MWLLPNDHASIWMKIDSTLRPRLSAEAIAALLRKLHLFMCLFVCYWSGEWCVCPTTHMGRSEDNFWSWFFPFQSVGRSDRLVPKSVQKHGRPLFLLLEGCRMNLCLAKTKDVCNICHINWWNKDGVAEGPGVRRTPLILHAGDR